MRAIDAEQEFRSFISNRGLKFNELNSHDAINMMISFYDEVRAVECNLGEDGDMLLFQWGVYDCGEGEHFAYNITRQFIFPEKFEDDEEEWEEDAMWQLSLTLKYPPSEAMRTLEAGNIWCYSPNDIDGFKEFINNNKATEVIRDNPVFEIELYYEQV